MIQNILERLEKVKSSGAGKYMACCPAHADRSPSLSLQELDDGRILMHCFAGCPPVDVLTALDIAASDLYPESLANRIVPLYMATQEKKKLATIHETIKSCRLRLDMATEMRSRNMKLTKEDLETERDAFMEMKRLQSGITA